MLEPEVAIMTTTQGGKFALPVPGTTCYLIKNPKSTHAFHIILKVNTPYFHHFEPSTDTTPCHHTYSVPSLIPPTALIFFQSPSSTFSLSHPTSIHPTIYQKRNSGLQHRSRKKTKQSLLLTSSASSPPAVFFLFFWVKF